MKTLHQIKEVTLSGICHSIVYVSIYLAHSRLLDSFREHRSSSAEPFMGLILTLWKPCCFLVQSPEWLWASTDRRPTRKITWSLTCLWHTVQRFWKCCPGQSIIEQFGITLMTLLLQHKQLVLSDIGKYWTKTSTLKSSRIQSTNLSRQWRRISVKMWLISNWWNLQTLGKPFQASQPALARQGVIRSSRLSEHSCTSQGCVAAQCSESFAALTAKIFRAN